MNEKEMAVLLDRATRDLAPDVEALTAGGLRRGRARQDRRRMAAAMATTAAAVLAIVVAGAQLLGPGEDGRTATPADPAPRTASPAAPTTSTTTAPSRTRAKLAVTTAEVPAAFAALEPGQVSAPTPKSGPDAAPVVDFTWNGFGIRVGLTPDDYVTGEPVSDPARRCAEQADADSCRPGPDGAVIATSSATSPRIDGGTDVRSAWLFRPDGWDVLVMAYNGPTKEGPVIAESPPFTVSELQRIASSDTWFR